MWLVSVLDLQFRARRFVIAVVVTSLVFGIALAIDGMRRSVQSETPAIVALFGADHWIVARGSPQCSGYDARRPHARARRGRRS